MPLPSNTPAGWARLARLLLLLLLVAPGVARAGGEPDPEIAVAKKHFRLGAQFYENGDYVNALREFETAQRVKPLPAFDYNIGLCYDRLERYPEAVAAYERFVAGTPDPFEADEARARIKVLKDRKASAPVPKAGAQDAEANKMLEKGIALFKEGKLADARAVFFQLRKLVPDKANPYRWLGMTYARLGQCPEAVTNLNNFLERVPEEDPRVAEVTSIRDRCKEDLQPKNGTLVVESTPAGAEVLLDDEKGAVLGRTPYRNAAVAAGEHFVYIRKAGFETLTKRVSVGKKETVSLDVALRASAPPPPPPVVAVAPKSKVVEKAPPVEKVKPPPVEKSKPVVAMVEKVKPVSPPVEAPKVSPPPPPPVESPPPAPSEKRPISRLAAPIGLAVGAVALAGAGLGLSLSVAPEFSKLQTMCLPGGTCSPDVWAGLDTRNKIGWGLMAAGGAAAAVDVVLWVLAMRKPAATRTVWFSPTLGGVVASGVF